MLPLVLLMVGCDAKGPDSTLEVAVQSALSADLSEDAVSLVLASTQHGGSFWNLSRSERLYNWNHESGQYSVFRAVAISADGRVAVTVRDTDLLVWDATSGSSLNYWRAPSKVLAITLSPDGRYALLGMQNYQVSYFDLVEGRALVEFSHEAEIYGVALSEDGRFAMTGSDDQTARLWRLSDGQLVHTFEHDNQVKTVALSADGSKAFSTAQREDAVIWDTASGAALTKLDYRYENFTAARFSADGSQLLLGTFRGDVYLVDSADGTELGHWKADSRSAWGPGSSGAVLTVAFAASGEITAVTSDGLVQKLSR